MFLLKWVYLIILIFSLHSLQVFSADVAGECEGAVSSAGEFVELPTPVRTALTAAGIDTLLSTRIKNIFQWEEIHSIDDLLDKTEEDLLRLRGLGQKSVTEIKFFLARRGLKLKEPPGSVPSEVLRLFLRIKRILLLAGVDSVEALSQMTEEELLNLQGIGPAGVTEVKALLAERELKLKGSPLSEFAELLPYIRNTLFAEEITSVEMLREMTEEELLQLPGVGSKNIAKIKTFLAKKGLKLQDIPLSELSELSSRVRRILQRADINSVEELEKRSKAKLLRLEGMGSKGIAEIKAFLASQGKKLKETSW